METQYFCCTLGKIVGEGFVVFYIVILECKQLFAYSLDGFFFFLHKLFGLFWCQFFIFAESEFGFLGFLFVQTNVINIFLSLRGGLCLFALLRKRAPFVQYNKVVGACTIQNAKKPFNKRMNWVLELMRRKKKNIQNIKSGF